MKRILLFFALLAATFTLNSCERSDNHYDPSLYEVVAGRTWVGDLGFYDRYNVPLESGVYLAANGFGEDELCYFPPREECVGKAQIRWSSTEDSIYIDYGTQYAPREIKHIYIDRGRLCGDLYIYDPYYPNPYYGHISLVMQ